MTGMAAVLWDMDGTIVDSEGIWLDVTEAMLARFGIEMTDATKERMVGSGLREAARHYQDLGVPLTADEMVAEWIDKVSAGLRSVALDWRPGARELLASLNAAGVPCALVTMSVRVLADLVVEQLPPGTFQAVIAGDEVAFEKPHPAPYLAGADALGVPIERCLAIEDSPTGVRSAFAAGAVTIGVPHHVSLAKTPAHELWPSLHGIEASHLAQRFAAVTATIPVPTV